MTAQSCRATSAWRPFAHGNVARASAVSLVVRVDAANGSSRKTIARFPPALGRGEQGSAELPEPDRELAHQCGRQVRRARRLHVHSGRVTHFRRTAREAPILAPTPSG